MNNMQVLPFDKSYQRSQFDCGIIELNHYAVQQMGQDVQKNVASPFVILNENKVIAFYTLSASSVNLHDLPAEITKKLPKYPLIPVILLGRLAVDKNYQKQGLGSFLLMDALKRSLKLSKEIGIMSVVVDAKNETAVDFYKQYNFKKMVDNRLFLPIQIIEQSFSY